jgi:ribosomal protein S2
MSYISMKQLLEAGVHFGHETKRWNPKFKRFIFAERNGIFIIDLQKTLKQVDRSFDFITKEVIAVQEANRLGIPVIALADTDSDPDVIDYIVPGNDDAIRSIQLIAHRIGDLLVEARGGGEDVSGERVEGSTPEMDAAESGAEGDTSQLTSSQGRS